MRTKIIHNYKTELIRFVFSVLIVFYHLTPILGSIIPGHQGEFATLTTMNCHVGTELVLAFFTISGFYFCKGKEWEKPPHDFIIGRVIRLWPVLAFSIIVHYQNEIDFLNLFFINIGLGVLKSGSSNPASWYVCVLFWLSLVFYYWFRNSKKASQNAMLLLTVIIGYTLIAHRDNGGYWLLISPQLPLLTNGCVLFLSGFSSGVLLYALYGTLSTTLSRYIDNSRMMRIAVELIWLALFIYFVYLVAFCEKHYEDLYYQFLFCVLFLLSQIHTQIPKPINRVIGVLGASSYAVYLMQFPCFYYIQKVMALQPIILGPRRLTMFLVGLCTMVGLAVHILVEKPLVHCLKKAYNAILLPSNSFLK